MNFGNLNLFRLPARSRFGEGRDFEFRASNFIIIYLRAFPKASAH